MTIRGIWNGILTNAWVLEIDRLSLAKSDVYTLENFERCNIKGLNKQKINELDSKILSEYLFQTF